MDAGRHKEDSRAIIALLIIVVSATTLFMLVNGPTGLVAYSAGGFNWESQILINAGPSDSIITQHIVFGQNKLQNCVDNIYIEANTGELIQFATSNEVHDESGLCAETDVSFNNIIFQIPESSITYEIYYGKIAEEEASFASEIEEQPSIAPPQQEQQAQQEQPQQPEDLEEFPSIVPPEPLLTPSLTTISSCQNLTSADTFEVTTNIAGVQSSDTVCIRIKANDVTLDCKGFSITGTNTGGTTGIYIDDFINRTTIQNCTVKNYGTGIRINGHNWTINNVTSEFHNVHGVSASGGTGFRQFIKNSRFRHNAGTGITLTDNADNTTVINNNVTNITGTAGIGDTGIWIVNGDIGLNVTRNNITNSSKGIFVNGPCTDCFIYDNFMANNTANAQDNVGTNWNITKTSGTNILGGPFIGGNFFSNYTGTDGNFDRIGDTNHTIAGTTGGTDFLPLTLNSTCGNVTSGSANPITLVNNLSGVRTGGSSCVEFQTDNKVLNCAGFTIDHNDASNTAGVNSTSRKNITVQNCLITDYDIGINLTLTNDSVIFNSSISSMPTNGIEDSLGNNNSIINSTVRNNGVVGISLLGTNNSLIANNSVFGNLFGVALVHYAFGLGSYRNNVTGNNASSNTNTGIDLGGGGGVSGALNSTVLNNLVTNNGFSGIRLWVANFSTVQNNNITANPVGIQLVIGTGNTFSNNNISGSGTGAFEGDITLSAGGSGEPTENNVFTGERLSSAKYWNEDPGNLNIRNNTMIASLLGDDNITFIAQRVDIENTTTPPDDPVGSTNISHYINITNVTTTSWLLLNWSYTTAEVSAASIVESTLNISKNNDSGWFTNPASFANLFGVDTANNVVFANITNFNSIFAPLGSTSITIPCNMTILVDGSVSNALTNAGEPYNISANVTNADGTSVNATIKAQECNGVLHTALIQTSVSNVSNCANASVVTGNDGFVSWTSVPTGGFDGTEAYIGDYDVKVEAICCADTVTQECVASGGACDAPNQQFSICNSTTLTVTNRDLPVVSGVKTDLPNRQNIIFFNDQLLRVFDRVQRADTGSGAIKADHFVFTVWDNGTFENISGVTFTSGRPTGINITFLNDTDDSGIDGGQIRIIENNSILAWSLLQTSDSNVSNVVVGNTTTDSNGNVSFTIVPTGGFSGVDSSLGSYNLSIAVALPNGTVVNSTVFNVDRTLPDPTGNPRAIPNEANIRFFNDQVLRIFDRIQRRLS